MKIFAPIAIITLVLLLHVQGCDTSATNEPGVDIEHPKVSFVTPQSGDPVGSTQVNITLSVEDNDRVTHVLLYLDDSDEPFDELTEEPWESVLDASNLTGETHRIRAVAYDATGNESLPASVTLGDMVLRMSLVEIVTSANCPPCAPMNEIYQEAANTSLFQERVATIKYHVWWPRPTDRLWHESQTWTQPRVEYLFSPIPPSQYGAPRGWVGGKMISNKADEWIATAEVDMEAPAGAKIELKSTRSGDQVTLTIHVTGISTADSTDLRLITAVTESDIEYSDGNGETEHFDVLRRMYPDAGGEAVTIGNGVTQHITHTIDIPEFWNPDNLHAVVFLQTQKWKSVLQAAKIDL